MANRSITWAAFQAASSPCPSIWTGRSVQRHSKTLGSVGPTAGATAAPGRLPDTTMHVAKNAPVASMRRTGDDEEVCRVTEWILYREYEPCVTTDEGPMKRVGSRAGYGSRSPKAVAVLIG